MSLSDTQNAKKFASIAEIAAAQAKLYALTLENAPDYAEQAQASAEAAESSAEFAQQSESTVSALATSASQSAADAASSAEDAGSAAEMAVAQCLRVPAGESIGTLPDEISRASSVLTFDENSLPAVKLLSEFAVVDSTGKLPVSIIPSIALTEPFVVNSEAAMLALDAQAGDIAKRTDLGYSFCLAASPASSLSNWVQLTDDVLAQLGQQSGASQIGALDDASAPTTVQEALNLKATKTALNALQSSLSLSTGASNIGVLPQGNLSQLVQYVTPEQFGAIGDGTIHPLSERYSTLSAAQAIYPFVTALTQTIDWAACQAAENYARGKCPVRCPYYAVYRFGTDGMLQQGINSKWYGCSSPATDLICTTMVRDKTTVKPAFGKDAVVRVMDASAAGSPDEFVRGVVFRGIKTTRNVARRTATKNVGDMCYHANMAMKAEVDVTCNGAEYGFFGYVCWGMTGTIRVDSCHKGVWLDAATATPEFTPVAGSAITCMDLRIEVDATPFGLVLRRCKYSNFRGFVEGILATSTYANYDYTNETAIAVTAYGCDSVDITQLGIEAWQGSHLYADTSSLSFTESWTQDYTLSNTTGKHGPYQAMATLMTTTELFTLPSTNNSYFYVMNGALVSLKNMTGDMSSASFANTFLVTLTATSRFVLDNCGIYFGSSRLIAPLDGNWANISFVNDRFFKDYMIPSGYTWIGSGRCQTTAWTLGSIGATGQVTITAPTGWSIVDFRAYSNVGTNTQAGATGIVALSGAPSSSSITLQTNFSGTAGTYSVYYKLTLSITK